MNWTGGQRKKGVFHNNQLLLGHKQQKRKKAAHQPGASSSNHAGAGSTDNCTKTPSIYSFNLFNQVESFKQLHDLSKK